MMIDDKKVRREGMRWLLLLAVYNARPTNLHESVILTTAQAMYADASALEIRQELDYLSDRKLVDLTKEPSGVWRANLTRYGTDVVEYTSDCQPGIARPVKYW